MFVLSNHHFDLVPIPIVSRVGGMIQARLGFSGVDCSAYLGNLDELAAVGYRCTKLVLVLQSQINGNFDKERNGPIQIGEGKKVEK